MENWCLLFTFSLRLSDHFPGQGHHHRPGSVCPRGRSNRRKIDTRYKYFKNLLFEFFSDHSVNLKHCGITDKDGRNEITLIRGFSNFTPLEKWNLENVPDSTRTHVRLVRAPGTIGPNENNAAVFAFQGHSVQSLPKSWISLFSICLQVGCTRSPAQGSQEIPSWSRLSENLETKVFTDKPLIHLDSVEGTLAP